MISVLLITVFFSTLISFLLKKDLHIKFWGLITSSILLIESTVLLTNFNKESYTFQNLTTYNVDYNILNLSYSFGVDGISVCFIFLSSLLTFLCVLFVWNANYVKEYIINLLLIELFLLVIFTVLDFFLFYTFFEAILVPMYLIIGIWGSRERKIRAVYLFFFYTLCGSLLLLIGILYIYSVCGTLNLEYLLAHKFSFEEQLFLWIAFFLSFASKIPMFPLHIWLPEAHVEAPTVGSVLLAGILLKLGVYGFIRFSLTLLPEASLYFSPVVYLLSVLGILYGSFTALRQTDLKRIIAYSSVAHMNLVTLGIFSFNIMGLEGSILQSLSHGFVAGGLFLLIGIIYERYHTRFVYYYGGTVHFMPLYTTIFLIFTLANIALPGTSSFTGEFLLLIGIYRTNTFAGILACLGVILSGAYALWLFNRISFGNVKVSYTQRFLDLNMRELLLMFPLLVFVFLMGIFPNSFLSYLTVLSNNLVLSFY
jgi:NADH-quinone oxidoreductase subunit M